MSIELAQSLIDHGIPVVVCQPNPKWFPGAMDEHGKPLKELWQPNGWGIITADECDLSRYRPGIDTLAMVGGHGVDVVDVDTKDGGTLDNLPPFEFFGETLTPSGGVHRYVRSTGVGKMSPLETTAGHVGDYVGGTPEGGSRMLAYLPGSTRPKYKSATYVVTQQLDLDKLLESDPDDDLIAALIGAGGRREGKPGKPAAKLAEVEGFLAEHSEVVEHCAYGRAAIQGLIDKAETVVPGDPKRGRHGWAVRSATRAVELIRAGCASSTDLDELERTLDRIKPEGGTDWYECVAWGIANADGGSACTTHGPAALEFMASLQHTYDVGDQRVAIVSDDQTEAQLDAAAKFAREVSIEAYKIAVREAAKDRVASDRAALVEVPPFDAGLLVDILARPAEPPNRIEELIPSDAGTLIVAQRKTGKTTLMLNLARSLILGEPFLGRFDVRSVTGRVAMLNLEVSGAQLARWADEVGVPQDRLYLVNLRGRRNPLGNDADREQLAGLLRSQQAESLIVDPFGRAYTGKSQNDPGEVGAWLSDLDRFARGDVGVVDLILAAHAGWNGERTRGASALEDWADSIVTLTRDADDDSQRYFRAVGRDVEVDEDRLRFDPVTRSLSLTGAGSRKVAAKTRHVEELIPAIVKVVTEAPGITGYGLQKALREAGESFQRGDELKAVQQAVSRGELRFEDGPRNSKMYFITSTYPDLPRPTPTGVGTDLPPPPLIEVGEVREVKVVDLPQQDPLPLTNLAPTLDDAVDTVSNLLGGEVIDDEAAS